jgi:hypothetical protein
MSEPVEQPRGWIALRVVVYCGFCSKILCVDWLGGVVDDERHRKEARAQGWYVNPTRREGSFEKPKAVGCPHHYEDARRYAEE